MTNKKLPCPKCGHPVKEYKNPLPTVDIIIELEQGVVLIERNNYPFGWALPGGFVDYGESLEEAAAREAREETGLSIKIISQLGSYSSPERDPRFHTISTVFIATAQGIPVGHDDAKQAAIFSKENIPPLTFDHQQILNDYWNKKK